MLVSTKKAAQATGLSAYELRRGWKEGRYPALVIGDRENKQVRLRWQIESLEKAIRSEMERGMKNPTDN